jgi:hypothetical protein
MEQYLNILCLEKHSNGRDYHHYRERRCEKGMWGGIKQSLTNFARESYQINLELRTKARLFVHIHKHIVCAAKVSESVLEKLEKSTNFSKFYKEKILIIIFLLGDPYCLHLKHELDAYPRGNLYKLKFACTKIEIKE